MKFLLFAGSYFYPSGGMFDYKGEFDDLITAIKIAESGQEYLDRNGIEHYDWYHIQLESKIVYASEKNNNGKGYHEIIPARIFRHRDYYSKSDRTTEEAMGSKYDKIWRETIGILT